MKVIKAPGKITLRYEEADNGAGYVDLIEISGVGCHVEIEHWRASLGSLVRTGGWLAEKRERLDLPVHRWLTILELIKEHLHVSTVENECVFQFHVHDERDPTIPEYERLRYREAENLRLAESLLLRTGGSR